MATILNIAKRAGRDCNDVSGRMTALNLVTIDGEPIARRVIEAEQCLSIIKDGKGALAEVRDVRDQVSTPASKQKYEEMETTLTAELEIFEKWCYSIHKREIAYQMEQDF